MYGMNLKFFFKKDNVFMSKKTRNDAMVHNVYHLD